MTIIPVSSWPTSIATPNKLITGPSVAECVEYGYRLLTPKPVTPTGKRILSEIIIQDPDDETKCKYEITYEDDPNYQMLVAVINIYKSFLINEWTTCLRSFNLIQPEQTVDWENTDTTTNMLYIMQLRSLDTEVNKPTYSYFKNEFESFRINIERLGGNMSSLQ